MLALTGAAGAAALEECAYVDIAGVNGCAITPFRDDAHLEASTARNVTTVRRASVHPHTCRLCRLLPLGDKSPDCVFSSVQCELKLLRSQFIGQIFCHSLMRLFEGIFREIGNCCCAFSLTRDQRKSPPPDTSIILDGDNGVMHGQNSISSSLHRKRNHFGWYLSKMMEALAGI